MSSFILPALVLLAIYFFINKGKKIREQESSSDETLADKLTSKTPFEEKRAPHVEIPATKKQPEPTQKPAQYVDQRQILLDNNVIFNMLIPYVEKKFANNNNIIEFEFSDSFTGEYKFLIIRYSVVVGMLNEREKWLLKTAMVWHEFGEVHEGYDPEQFHARAVIALSRFSWTYESTYKGYSPSGLEAAKSALDLYKRKKAELETFDEEYAYYVSHIIEVSKKYPGDVFSEWALKQLNSGQGWASSR